MKVTVIRTDPAGTHYFGADTRSQISDTSHEPVRLLPALADPQPVTEKDLEYLRKVLTYTHKSKLEYLPRLIGTTTDEMTEVMLRRGDQNIVDHYTVMLEATRQEEWEAKDRKRQQSLSFWVFKNKVVKVEGWEAASREEVVTRVVHKVLSEEKAFDKMKADIERFQIMERASVASREPIPEDVRIFVWRRDQGKCVTCGSQERIEYDHIIPIEKGGSNTTRNIQVLCQTCNRKKGTSI